MILLFIAGLSTVKLIALCVLSFAIFSFSYAYAKNYTVRRRAQEDEYERKYRWIQCQIETLPTTPGNYDSIMRMLTCLGSLPHRNKEKTEILTNQFLIRFKVEVNAQLTEEEFTPEQIFRIR